MKKIIIALAIVLTIGFIGCSQQDEQKTTKAKNNELLTSKSEDSLKDGDTLTNDYNDYKIAEFVKNKHLGDSLFIDYTHEDYGTGRIVCRKPNKRLNSGAGEYGQASGCFYSPSTGLLYTFTWTEAHSEFDGELHTTSVPAHSTYTVNSGCSCP